MAKRTKRQGQRADLAALDQIAQVIRAYGEALDMSDPDSPAFRDSCADVVEHLWQHAATVRALIFTLDIRRLDRIARTGIRFDKR